MLTKIKVATQVTLLMVLLGLLSGCGPRLKQVKNYQPPMTVEGGQCTVQAQQNKNQCDQINSSNLERCLVKAERSTEREFRKQERLYTRALENYIALERQHERDLADYEQQKQLLIKEGELDYIKCSKDVELLKINQFPNCKPYLDKARKRARDLHSPLAPIQPSAPSKHRIFSQFRVECEAQKIDCESRYDEQYIACGGSILYDTVCVANCD